MSIKEYKPNKMEKQILNDLSNISKSLTEISEAVNVMANAKIIESIRPNFDDETIEKRKQNILKTFNILK
tara:strand:+ start:273 stop:482 length:210 start_codon:yes stop_codon:yes gene_type:complete